MQTWNFLGDTPRDDVSHKAICIVSPPSQTNQTLFTQVLELQKESRIKSINLSSLHHSSWSRGKKIRDHIPKEELASQLPTCQMLLLRNYRSVSIPCIWWALTPLLFSWKTSTWTSQFLKPMATILSITVLTSIDTDEQEEPISCFPVPLFWSVFSSPTPRNSRPLQSGRNPLHKQKKQPGSTFCSPGSGSPQNSGSRAHGTANCAINSRSQSTEAWLWP